MPLFKSINVPKGLLSVWQITESSDELLPFFTPEEITDPEFQKFTFEKRKTEWLATRALLKQMIGPSFQISYTESGKPLFNHPVYAHISISHSRDFVAVFIHEHLSVGIDIESMNRNYSAIRKKYLSESELEDVNESPLLQCIYWCAKEAVFKLVEDDGVDFRKQIEVMAFDSQEDAFLVRYISDNQEKTYQLQHTTFNDQCMVWVCGDLSV
jgi:phosphopantetheinyl transferase